MRLLRHSLPSVHSVCTDWRGFFPRRSGVVKLATPRQRTRPRFCPEVHAFAGGTVFHRAHPALGNRRLRQGRAIAGRPVTSGDVRGPPMLGSFASGTSADASRAVLACLKRPPADVQSLDEAGVSGRVRAIEWRGTGLFTPWRARHRAVWVSAHGRSIVGPARHVRSRAANIARCGKGPNPRTGSRRVRFGCPRGDSQWPDRQGMSKARTGSHGCKGAVRQGGSALETINCRRILKCLLHLT